MVSDSEWQDFLARSVTPRFPDGITVLEGRGRWRERSSGKVVSEPSEVVEIVTDASPETMQRLEAIRDDYKARFSQESVGLVIAPSCASL